MVALAVVGMGGGSSTGSGTTPRPQSTVRYPIKFNSTTTVKQQPQPTVSYPIPWERSDGNR
ncbi:hypothetical protein [Streptomyces sp. V4I8]|uniref:hypothetical protein n=1 Tax=Streptomyces sp. V4I8 TaxID=3156469 RepID=UPI003513B951